MQFSSNLLTRQQVASRAGLSDDVLSFWIKQGLLQATSGGVGRGSHRRFDIFQVNIAAVLAELRRFGVNVGILRRVAHMLQRGTALAIAAPCNFWGISDAVDLASLISRQRSGERLLVVRSEVEGAPDGPRYGEAGDAWEARNFRRAETEGDVVTEFLRSEDLHDAAEPIVSMAGAIAEDDILPLRLFVDLNHPAFRYVWDGHIAKWGDSGWILAPTADDGLDVFRGPAEHDLLGKDGLEVRSGLFLGPAAIFRSVWGNDLQPYLIHEAPPSEERRDARRRALARAAELREASRTPKA